MNLCLLFMHSFGSLRLRGEWWHGLPGEFLFGKLGPSLFVNRHGRNDLSQCFPFHGIPPPRITASMLEIILIPSTSHENDAIGFWYPHVAHHFNVPKVLVHWNYPSQIVVAPFPIIRSQPETLRFSRLFELMYRTKGQLLHSNHLAFKSSSSTFCCISNIGNWIK
jgi:hypothetical protein